MKKPFEGALVQELAKNPDTLVEIIIRTGSLRGAMKIVWPLMNDTARRRFVTVLTELARKPRVNAPRFHVTITERCSECGANLNWTKLMQDDEVSTEPLLPDRPPRHDA